MTTHQIILASGLISILIGIILLCILVFYLIDCNRRYKREIINTILEMNSDIKHTTKQVDATSLSMLYWLCMQLGNDYIKAGHISIDELENYDKYLYEPYKKLKGNGMIDEIREKVFQLLVDCKKKKGM